MFFEVFLYAYYGNNDNYTQDLKHLKIFEYKAEIHILKEKQAKFYKYICKKKENILVSYKDIKIFQIDFLLKKKIE